MLTTEQIKQTVSEYFKDKPVKKVYLFGSYARGEANEESDVDISIIVNQNAEVTYLTLANYLIDLESRLKRKVDLVEDEFIYEGFKSFINQSKILLLDK